MHVIAPCRLHFGLFSFGQPNRRQFGGVGMMLSEPALRLRFLKSDEFEVVGPLRDRLTDYVTSWTAWHDIEEPPAYQIIVESAPRLHVGLGVGTQLGLSVAAALAELTGRSRDDAPSLAGSVGRGQRSAVGTFGFFQGGLIAESGKHAGESLSSLADRVPFPETWRIVLITPRGSAGLHGRFERQAFADLDPVPLEVTEQLELQAFERIVPAARQERFDDFCQGIYEFGRLAGSCFASIQGGPYNGPKLQAVVDTLRSMGHEGIGQSSWGPTIYAMARDADAAQQLTRDLRGVSTFDDCDIAISAASNCGAQIR